MVEDTKKEMNENQEKAIDVVEQKPASNDTAEDFGKMLEESLLKSKSVQKGEEITGKIINITDAYIFIAVGDKQDAYAEKSEYFDANGELVYKIGDMLTGFVVKKSETEIVISKSLNKSHATKSVLKDAFERKIPVSGKVQSIIKGGYSVDVLGVRAFCPLSQMALRPVSDNTEFLGHNFDFEIIDFGEKGRNVIISRRILLEKEIAEKRKETLANIEVGSVLKGIVTRMTNFGAFVDLGGIDGLVHVSQISWSRVESPSDVLKEKQEVEVKVIKLDGEKISLSMKALEINPFELALKELDEGMTVSCKVVRNTPFGSFVQIKPGVEGLIPISEMSRGRRINHPGEILQEGDQVEAQIMNIKVKEKKISLSLKALQADPWEDIDEKFKSDDVISGIIESIANFGVFINIADGLTGLLPISKLQRGHINIGQENIGEEITLKVFDVDKKRRRISLEPTEMAPLPPRKSRKQKQNKDENFGRSSDNFKQNDKQKDWGVPEDNPFRNL